MERELRIVVGESISDEELHRFSKFISQCMKGFDFVEEVSVVSRNLVSDDMFDN